MEATRSRLHCIQTEMGTRRAEGRQPTSGWVWLVAAGVIATRRALAHISPPLLAQKKKVMYFYLETPVTWWSHTPDRRLVAQEIRVSTGGVLDCGVDTHDGRWRACPLSKNRTRVERASHKQLDRPPGRQRQALNCSRCYCIWEGSELVHVPHRSTDD